MKYVPVVGEKMYISQRPCGNCWVDEVKHPYSVIAVKDKEILIRECGLKFSGPRYYDSLPDEIYDDPYGRVRKLKWSDKKGVWQESGERYAQIGVFGEGWQYAPYLN